MATTLTFDPLATRDAFGKNMLRTVGAGLLRGWGDSAPETLSHCVTRMQRCGYDGMVKAQTMSDCTSPALAALPPEDLQIFHHYVWCVAEQERLTLLSPQTERALPTPAGRIYIHHLLH